MQSIPRDSFMLLSFLNMKLRDEFSNLKELILFYKLDEKEVIKKMSNINYFYDEEINQFKVKV